MLAIASVRKDSETAGLSPNGNKRTEVFFAGCNIARAGQPCPGCFNKDLWYDEYFQKVSVEKLMKDIEEIGNHYVTIVGGEPLDQYEELARLLDKLWTKCYHTTVITHYTIDEIRFFFPKVLDFASTIIDGAYVPKLRVFDENKRPGIYHVIGSSNQHIWTFDCETIEWRQVDMEDDEDLKYAYGA